MSRNIGALRRPRQYRSSEAPQRQRGLPSRDGLGYLENPFTNQALNGPNPSHLSEPVASPLRQVMCLKSKEKMRTCQPVGGLFTPIPRGGMYYDTDRFFFSFLDQGPRGNNLSQMALRQVVMLQDGAVVARRFGVRGACALLTSNRFFCENLTALKSQGHLNAHRQKYPDF